MTSCMHNSKQSVATLQGCQRDEEDVDQRDDTAVETEYTHQNTMKRLFQRKEKLEKKPEKKKLPTGSPPTNCVGYPPAIVPQDIPDAQQVHFYIPTQDGQEAIACSLYCSPSSVSATPKKVNGIRFRLDSNKPVIIICHGYMSWRNQMLLAHLAGGLQKTQRYHTLRFDFVGNGHSTGIFSTAKYDREFQNLQDVRCFVQETLQCKIACVVGHSKSVASVLRTAVEQETYDDTKIRIPCFVNMSGPYSVPQEYDVSKRYTAEQVEELNRLGTIVLAHPPGGREMVMTLEGVEERKLLDSSVVKNIQHAAVLTIHGSRDAMAGVHNAHKFAKIIPKHELCIVEGADHNYNGLRHIQVLVKAVANFVDKQYSLPR